ncbi:ABC transporter substrate-binding protein [Microbacterium sp. CH12i]|uniref:ABC transporter substrate-binding protein n=1 Tax=Microbacterium sp. CH12i TaxID=1479651 RepID=UPI001F39D67B|nr:ABC transporter substrate-binding protein [Microbacterium sp. CH12i]
MSLVACAPAMPETVVQGTAVTVGWTNEFTSANPAASPTSGNIDIAEATRGDFGDVIDGEFVPDEGFGKITIVNEDPFTVQYDLAEPSWSDSVPLDAADLLLGWAGVSGYFADSENADSSSEEPTAIPAVPSVDEFARSIKVTFPAPVMDWQQAATVPVAAHVVGSRALGIDDPMEAKQAVIRAIQEDDTKALAAISKVWNEGFQLPDRDELPADLLVSSGPFQVEEVSSTDNGQSITLVPNSAYRGLVTPQVARIELVPPPDDPVTAVGDLLDIAQVAPVASNQAPIHELERRDFTVSTTYDGTIWAMLLNPVGFFTPQQARSAFIHAVQASAVTQRGAGAWASAYTATTSMVAAPGSRAYDIVNEDSGFAQKLGAPAGEPALERESAGLSAGSPVCVLYDRRSEFASGAFAALRDTAAEAGWSVVDCGSDDFDAALAQRGWDAVITRVPVPQTTEQISAQWGSAGTASITQNADPERDALIAQLEQTTDVYKAREVRAQIEATIVNAAVALPLAANPRVTIVDPGVSGVTPRSGAAAPLTSGVSQWAVVP